MPSVASRSISPSEPVPPVAEAPSPLLRWLPQIGLAVAVALGVVVRAVHVLSAKFPLNDGALFYAMTQDIQRAGYHLPAFTSYNAANIPFGYSPLGFYAAALVNDVTGLALIDVFRWLPLVMTALTVAAFALLASAMLRSRWMVVVAVAAFALTPRSFIWLIMGGGLTRSFGFLFAILALHQVYRLYTRREWQYAAGAAVLAALTVFSHLGTAPFVAFSSAILFLTYGRHRHGVISSVVVAVSTVVLTAPWWADVILTHGLGPFVAALGTGGTIFSGETLNRVLGALRYFGLGTSEPLLSLIGMLGVVGALASFRPGRRVLPAWWLATVVLDQRAGSTYATLPLAMLVGIGVIDVVLPLLMRRGLRAEHDTARDGRMDTRHGLRHLGLTAAIPRGAGLAGSRRRYVLPGVVLGVFLSWATFSAMLRNPAVAGDLGDLNALAPAEVDAMRWVSRATPAPSRFLVIAQTPWEIDRAGEWFPVLANRLSVSTVQGTEWLPNNAFRRKEHDYNELQGCGNWVSVCVDDWARVSGVEFTHIYIPKVPGRQCCRMLLFSLENDPRYAVIYDGPGAAVFANRVAVAALTGDRSPATTSRGGGALEPGEGVVALP